jgi:pyruvate,orthophosphate dikinase
MKISSLALSYLVLLVSASEAFQPPSKNAALLASSVSAKSSTTCLHVSTAPATSISTSTYTELGLENPSISLFGKGRAGASSDARRLLGGKGANLAEMSHIGLSVPPGFTITTECCKQFCGDWNQKIPAEIWKEVLKSLKTIEDAMDCTFGSEENPLLLSVRSGAAISMPGMMDTILNLGINDAVVEGLAKKSNNPRFAWDSYRRFLEMFGNVVLEIPRTLFEDELDEVKYEAGVFEDAELSTEHLKEIVRRFKGVYAEMDLSFPEDVFQQLELAVGAVFKGWMGERAVKYREVENIRNLLGTAVSVQAMVFGNMGDTSGTGVCFTRDPNNGENTLFGEFLINAQGEDVVAGIRTPKPISELQAVMPGTYMHIFR